MGPGIALCCWSLLLPKLLLEFHSWFPRSWSCLPLKFWWWKPSPRGCMPPLRFLSELRGWRGWSLPPWDCEAKLPLGLWYLGDSLGCISADCSSKGGAWGKTLPAEAAPFRFIDLCRVGTEWFELELPCLCSAACLCGGVASVPWINRNTHTFCLYTDKSRINYNGNNMTFFFSDLRFRIHTAITWPHNIPLSLDWSSPIQV